MSKFIQIIINKRKMEFKNIQYLPQIIALYERFSRYLNDDYFSQNETAPIDAVLGLVERTSPFFWAVVNKKNGKLAGFVFLDNWVGAADDFHSVEVTTCFNPMYWGNYTKICAKKFIKYCFKKYKLKKLKALIFSQNFKVKALLNRSGFKKEALLKAETLKNGQLQDIEVFSIIKKQNENKNKLEKEVNNEI
jgi:RimJ/RimL family protein N-acetyltransferase